MQEPTARQYELKTNAEFVVSRLGPLRRRNDESLEVQIEAVSQNRRHPRILARSFPAA
jgi:hypothetical protein